MNNKDYVDIILPNFNSAKYIEKTLKSIFVQSYKKWKLIIIDDCSNDKTKNILKKYSKNKKIKIYWLKKNQGAGFCRNYGISRSYSKYIAFIDSDDIWKKNKLENQLTFMKKNNHLFSYTFYETFGEKKMFIKTPLKFNYQNFIHNTSIATSTMMVVRKKIKDIKFTNTKICEDYYFKCKLLKKVKYAFCLNKFLTNYRIRKDSLQSRNLNNLFWIWKINKEYNKLNFVQNLLSLLLISLNSLIKYKGKNLLY